MSLPVIFRARALLEIDDVYHWYEAQREGLGDSFMAALKQATLSIEHNPEQFRCVRGEVRRVLLKKFPYGVFYVVRPEFSSVIAVLHQARNPRQWQLRARSAG